jgi:hypothetical protein
MHENKDIFLKIFFWWKPDILIPDLYFYDLKMQTNINQNIKSKWENHKFSTMIYIFWLGQV